MCGSFANRSARRRASFDALPINLSKASVWKFDQWRHADDRPSREEAVRQLIRMLQKLIARAEGERLRLAPFIGIGCPGHIE